jgi:hypothetical protein
MIIKQIPFHGLYENLIDYFNRGASYDDDFTIFKNTQIGTNRNSVVSSFIQNDGYRKRVKTRAQHIIISFHEKDSKNVTPEMLYAIVNNFLETRGYSRCVVYGKAHFEKNAHIHLCVSQNYFLTDKSCDTPKKEYLRQNREVEYFQEEHYSKELANSFVYINEKKKELKQLQKSPKAKTKNKVIDTLNDLADKAKNLTDLYYLIETNHKDLKIYSRGNKLNYGVRCEKLNFRFTTVIRQERYSILERLEKLREIEERGRTLEKESRTITK